MDSLGNGTPLPKGGIVLGGRELRVRLDPNRAHNLAALAKADGLSVHAAATVLLEQAIDIAVSNAITRQAAEKVAYVLSRVIA